MGDRERLRQTFDAAADLYQRARPEHPDALLDRLVELTGAGPGTTALEVGCATGKATVPLARRGLRITAVELGPHLAAAARRNLAAFPDVEVVDGDFDRWAPPEPHGFDLVFAATAWQWTDPATRYGRAAAALRPGGHLAFWDVVHAFPPGGDPFFAEIQDVYDAIGETLPPGTPRPSADELPDHRAEIEAGGFEVVAVERFGWEVEYDADAYLDLLSTFSGHIAMEDRQRDHLYGEIRRRLARRDPPTCRRGWGAVLHVARVGPAVRPGGSPSSA